MNAFVASPDLARTIASQRIDERVAQAEGRARARAARSYVRARRETARLSGRSPQRYQLPWWAFRFVTPAH